MPEALFSTLKDAIFCDLQRELAVTRKVLQRVPDEHMDWKPHEKSMTFGSLAHHVAHLPTWLTMTLGGDGLDFANPPPQRQPVRTSAELLSMFDQNVAETNAAFAELSDADLGKTWTLRSGEHILHRGSKAMIARIWCLNHLVNHRAQLCVYLRLLDLPVPAVYFNSADEPDWNFQ